MIYDGKGIKKQKKMILTFEEASEEIKGLTGIGLIGLANMMGYEELGTFIEDLAEGLETDEVTVGKIVRGDMLPNGEVIKEIVMWTAEKMGTSEEEAADLYLDLEECVMCDIEKGEAEEEEYLTREREYTMALMEIEEREEERKLKQEVANALSPMGIGGANFEEVDELREEISESNYEVGYEMANTQKELNKTRQEVAELKRALEFEAAETRLYVGLEQQRVRAERLVEEGAMSPADYRYYFGDRENFPDAESLVMAFAERAIDTGIPVQKEQEYLERVLQDAEGRKREIMENYSMKQEGIISPTMGREYDCSEYVAGFWDRNPDRV